MKLEKDQAVLHIFTEPCLLFKVGISVLELGFKLPEGKGWVSSVHSSFSFQQNDTKYTFNKQLLSEKMHEQKV